VHNWKHSGHARIRRRSRNLVRMHGKGYVSKALQKGVGFKEEGGHDISFCEFISQMKERRVTMAPKTVKQKKL
jgi:hypothetical protein